MKKFTDKLNESVDDRIPTAEEVFEQNTGHGINQEEYSAMIEFAKMHVEAALKEASEKVKLDDLLHEFIQDSWEGGDKIKKESILNAYPLENIK